MPIQSLHKYQEPSQQTGFDDRAPRRKHLYWWKIAGAMVALMLSITALLGYRLIAAVNTTVEGNRRVSVLTQLRHLVAHRDADLKGESRDRINILLLGIGGAGHEGPLLADTIIVASIKPSTGQIALLSIPRDLAVEIPRYGIRKINNANAFGTEINYPGGGEQLSADIVSTITGEPLHYFGKIDFSGFKKIVDDLGGLAVTVERSFVDREYPTNNFGYQTIGFESGTQTMDGATALRFVRSRHGSNGEGSDFARSRRQQLILEAMRDKAYSLGTILNPVKIGNVLSSLSSHTRTNLEVWELLRLARIVRESGNHNVITRVLESGPNDPLKVATGLDGAFLLLPRDGTFNEVKAIVRNMFIQDKIVEERARIVIADSSGRLGTGKSLAASLVALGYRQPLILPSQGREITDHTLIIDYTGGSKLSTVQGLESYMHASSVSNAPPLLNPRHLPDILNGNRNLNQPLSLPPQPSGADILINLGKDYVRQQEASSRYFNSLRNAPQQHSVKRLPSEKATATAPG